MFPAFFGFFLWHLLNQPKKNCNLVSSILCINIKALTHSSWYFKPHPPPFPLNYIFSFQSLPWGVAVLDQCLSIVPEEQLGQMMLTWLYDSCPESESLQDALYVQAYCSTNRKILVSIWMSWECRDASSVFFFWICFDSISISKEHR